MARTITRKHAVTLQGYGFNTAKVARELKRSTDHRHDHRQTTAAVDRFTRSR